MKLLILTIYKGVCTFNCTCVHILREIDLVLFLISNIYNIVQSLL